MYSYTGNNPINYVDPTGHRFTANLTDTGTGGSSRSRGKDKNQEVVVPEPEDIGTIDNPGKLLELISPSEDYINTGYN